ncbi:MAG: bifunctional pyr operon transcriptional regulator/uracil phosphoribosyltransferase PyrR [Clostridia bacterium]|nr:bifunctional pyr operon transcriptional regulator/uracil phosphoribosyltransferase PyrR [Clostridia bacterium]
MKKVKIMDQATMMRSLARITHEIIEKNEDADSLCILGIKNRGTIIARILTENLKKFGETTVPCGEIDTTMYRDDFSPEEKRRKATESYVPFDITGKTIVIVDDVLYTGRTVRAAIEAVFALGRPRAVRFAVLVDRGHREIPIRPDYIGKNIPTSRQEKIAVVMDGAEEECGVFIVSADEKEERG